MKTANTSSVYGIFKRAAIPKGAEPITNFELNKYLGKWYDIARMNFKHETDNSTNVFLKYSLREDGLVSVNNNAFLEKEQKWYSRTGKAKLRGAANIGALNVTFDNIKWAGYNVIAVDEAYKYALVFGRNLNLMWILSRTKTIPEEIKNNYLKIAEKTGYNTSNLTYTKHDRDSS